MFNKSKIVSNLKSASSRFIRGLLLIIWILALSYVALGSLKGGLAKSLIATGGGSTYFDSTDAILSGKILNIYFGEKEKPQNPQKCPTGDFFLRDFRSFEINFPPIDALLDVIIPKWTVVKNKSQGCRGGLWGTKRWRTHGCSPNKGG